MQESKETDIETTPPPPPKKSRNKETVQFRESLIWVLLDDKILVWDLRVVGDKFWVKIWMM